MTPRLQADPTLAFVFPGQGSQSLAMLAELAEMHSIVRETFVEASDGAGDQDDFALQCLCVAHACFHSSNADWKSPGVASDLDSSDLSMRLIRPVNTLPGPHSAKRVAPFAANARVQSVQRTGR